METTFYEVDPFEETGTELRFTGRMGPEAPLRNYVIQKSAISMHDNTGGTLTVWWIGEPEYEEEETGN